MQASVSGASVKGLKGCKTLNKDPDPKNPIEGKEERYHNLHLFAVLYNNIIDNGTERSYVTLIGTIQRRRDLSWIC